MSDEAPTTSEPAPTEPIPAPIEPEIVPQTAQPETLPETATAQMAGNEPLAEKVEPLNSEPVSGEAKPAEIEVKPEIVNSEAKPVETQTSQPTQQMEAMPPSVAVPVVVQTSKNPFREFLNQAQQIIQIRKRKKLEKIMLLLSKKSTITNDEVEKLLHCSDATATRYLTILEKENKIKQTGKTGKGVSYSKI